MKKIFKIIITIIAIIIILFIIAGILLATLVNPNNFKNQISEAVYKETGRELAINGNIERSFFPWIGLRIHNVSLGNPPDFTNKNPFMTVGEADVNIKLMPLFSGKVEIGKVTLQNLDLNLIKNSAGKTNWENFSTKTKTTTPSQPTATTTQSASNTNHPNKPVSITISSIHINNANVTFTNEQTGQQIKIEKLQLKSSDVNLHKPFPLSLQFLIQSNKPALTAQISLDSNVTLDTTNLQFALEDLKLSSDLLGPNVSQNKMKIDLSANIAADLKQQTLNVSNLLITSNDLKAQGNVQGSQILSNPSFQGQLKVAQFNLKDFMSALGKPLNSQDPAALKRLALSTQFSATNKSLNLTQLDVNLDDSAIKGNINISNFKGPVMNFNIGINQLNLDRYLPADPPASAANGIPAAASKSSPAQASSAASADPSLRTARINGTLQVGMLIVSKIPLSNFYTQVAVNNSNVKLSPLNANLYEGSATGEVSINMQGSAPHYSINETLTGVDISQLLKSNRITGKGNVTANITMTGNDSNSMLHTLNGSTKFTVNNGALQGVNIPYQIERALALIKKQVPPAPTSDQTDFGQITGNGTFTNGVFNNTSLLLQSPDIKISGSGTANLITQQLDYHLKAVGMHTVTNAQGQTILEARQTEIPVQVTGTFSKPIVVPDLSAIAKTMIKSKVEERIQEKLNNLNQGNAPAGQIIKKAIIRNLLNQ